MELTELKQVLRARVGSCPAYNVSVPVNGLLRFCPLQREAVRAMESLFDGAGNVPEEFYISLFVPPGGGVSFGCATYKKTMESGAYIHGKPEGLGCPLEEAVVDQLLQLVSAAESS